MSIRPTENQIMIEYLKILFGKQIKLIENLKKLTQIENISCRIYEFELILNVIFDYSSN
jgi:hypothetical protein